MKELIKSVAKFIQLPLTKNLEYDILTEKIIRQLATEGKIRKCVDVGVLDGDILKLFRKYLPKEVHYGFEPIPAKFEVLKDNFEGMSLHNCALGKERGAQVYNHVVSNPSYSGLKRRKYPNEELIEEIKVHVSTLDEEIIAEDKIDLIKIDVEGGEFDVLKGGNRILSKDKPYLIFEFGLGASDYYGTTAASMWDLMTHYEYKIYLLKSWVKKGKALSLSQFEEVYKLNKEYYFIAE